MRKNTFMNHTRDLCNNNRCHRKNESSIEIWVYRPQVCVHRRKWKVDPVKNESKNISEKNEDKKPSNEWKKFASNALFSKGISKKCVKFSNDIDSKCSNFWKEIGFNRSIEYTNKYEQKHHKNPCRENRIANGNISEKETIYFLSLRTRNMWTMVLRSRMSICLVCLWREGFCWCMCIFGLRHETIVYERNRRKYIKRGEKCKGISRKEAKNIFLSYPF